MYDLIILGGGPGGTRAAELAAKAGLKTVVVEMDRLGGTCLNRGCIPTKAYYAALVGGRVSREEMWEYREGIVKKLGDGISTLMKMSGAEILRGKGKIASAGETKIVEVETADGKKMVEGRLLLLAPGARSLPLEFEGADLPGVLTGDWAVTEPDLWKYPDTEQVKSVGIIGAGVIAVEFAVAPWAHTVAGKILKILIELLSLTVLGVCLWLSLGLVERGMGSSSQALQITMGYVYMVVPVSFGMTILCALENLLRLLAGLVGMSVPPPAHTFAARAD